MSNYKQIARALTYLTVAMAFIGFVTATLWLSNLLNVVINGH